MLTKTSLGFMLDTCTNTGCGLLGDGGSFGGSIFLGLDFSGGVYCLRFIKLLSIDCKDNEWRYFGENSETIIFKDS